MECASGSQGEQPFHLCSQQHTQILQILLTQEQTGVAIISAAGAIQHVNHTLANLLLYRPEELRGRVLEGLALKIEPAGKSNGVTKAAQAEHQASPVVNQLVRKSADAIPCLVESFALRDRSDKITHFLVFVSDACIRKEAEERNRFERGLFQSQTLQTLGMLARGIAHDFNNALEVIIGFASLGRIRLDTADPLQEPLKIIEESAKGAAALTRQILNLSKDKPDDKREIDVEDLINSVIAIISRTFDRRIRIHHRVEPQLPCIRGVRNRLKQAILNLCINARDALLEGGTLTLEATSQRLKVGDSRLPPTNEPGTYIRIAVRDSGIGMTPEIMEKIFIPLFTTKEDGQGSGLGLAMVDRIVKETRGFISVASAPGEGTEFSLYLPAVFGKVANPADYASRRLLFGRGKLLVVDDEPRVLEFLEKGLTRLGYDVVSAESGNRACEIYSKRYNEINCVLLDLIMPGMSGMDTYCQLQRINPNLKVILSSGYSSGHLKGNDANKNGPEFLAKPYTLEELSQALKKLQQN